LVVYTKEPDFAPQKSGNAQIFAGTIKLGLTVSNQRWLLRDLDHNFASLRPIGKLKDRWRL